MKNNPQEHIVAALAHIDPIQKSGGGTYPPDSAQCQRAQAEAQIAIAMLLSGIGARFLEIDRRLHEIWERLG